mmetsp:Transcript_5935/g.21694  ORF Transcript_5935/g.21694 Transcript_5935/m.21694 type:complete len:200 (-) Transcript_5935:499-1098(-)
MLVPGEGRRQLLCCSWPQLAAVPLPLVLLAVHRRSATTCRTRGAYDFTLSTWATATSHRSPRSAHARACIRAAACSAHCATRPSATLPCTCKQPPCALRAATASRQLSSLLGSRPSSTRSACTLWLSSSPPPSLPSLTPRAAGATIGGMVLRLSPGSTTHLCATLLRSKFQRSAATVLGFHSHAYTLAAPARTSKGRVK